MSNDHATAPNPLFCGLFARKRKNLPAKTEKIARSPGHVDGF
jgi:hypothetical protein